MNYRIFRCITRALSKEKSLHLLNIKLFKPKQFLIRLNITTIKLATHMLLKNSSILCLYFLTLPLVGVCVIYTPKGVMKMLGCALYISSRYLLKNRCISLSNLYSKYMRYYLKHTYVPTDCREYIVIQAKYAYQ
jgi:hypothetical protein